jgi:hypothetical protein
LKVRKEILMNVTFPQTRRLTRPQSLLAVLAACALALAAGIAFNGQVGRDAAPSTDQATSFKPVAPAQSASTTFILVGSQEQADYLDALRRESEAFVDDASARYAVQFLVAATPEQETVALETVRYAMDVALGQPSSPPVYFVDARNMEPQPR